MLIKSYYTIHLHINIREVMKNMNKTAILSVTIFIIFCLTVSSLSFAPYTPTRTIATSGTIEPSTGIYKHLVAYGYSKGFTDEKIEFISSHFDMLDTHWYDDVRVRESIVKLKQGNPRLIVIIYISAPSASPAISYYGDWSEIDLHEDWFLHDVDGNRLQIVWKSGWYGMDIRSEGWREHLADWCATLFEKCPHIDGIFVDNAWKIFLHNLWTVPKEKIPIEYGQTWHEDMKSLLRLIKGRIGNKLLIANTQDTADYVDVCDGIMSEGFVHPKWHSNFDFRYNATYFINALSEISKKGKYFMAHSGARLDGTEADTRRVMLYCLASYLLGYHGDKTTFGWINIHGVSRGYCKEFDDAKQIGSPINEYYSIGSVYARDFAEGKVLVNPTTSSYTVDLKSECKTLDGQTVSSVTLNAHSGIILLRS